MNEKPGSKSWPDVHPDFDGHLEWPFERMTPDQKLAWLDGMIVFRAECAVSNPRKDDEERKPA